MQPINNEKEFFFAQIESRPLYLVGCAWSNNEVDWFWVAIWILDILYNTLNVLNCSRFFSSNWRLDVHRSSFDDLDQFGNIFFSHCLALYNNSRLNKQQKQKRNKTFIHYFIFSVTVELCAPHSTRTFIYMCLMRKE